MAGSLLGYDRLAETLEEIRAQVTALSTVPQLSRSSIEAGAILEYDTDGNSVSQIGEQFDGEHAAVSLAGTKPPRPSAPGVLNESPGAVTVYWDGTYVDAAGTPDIMILTPTTYTSTEIHASQDPEFTAETWDTLTDTFTSPRGGAKTITLPAGTWYIKLVTRTQSGNRSTPSPPGTVIVDPAITSAAFKVDAPLFAQQVVLGPFNIPLSETNSQDVAGLAFFKNVEPLGEAPPMATSYDGDSFVIEGRRTATSLPGKLYVGPNLSIYGEGDFDLQGNFSTAQVTTNYLLRAYGMVEYYDPPTSTFTANLGIATTPKDRIYKLGSSGELKVNRVPITDEHAWRLLELVPRKWYDRAQLEDLLGPDAIDATDRLHPKVDPALLAGLDIRMHPGLVAQEVHAAGLTEFVDYEDGEPSAVDYDRMWTLIIPILRYLLERVGYPANPRVPIKPTPLTRTQLPPRSTL